MNFFDLLNIVSIVIDFQNLKLNEQQSAELMSELRSNQDKMLQKIIEQNEVIIEQNKQILSKMEVNKNV